MGEVHTKPVRLDFPMFQKEDLVGWLYKVNHFVALHNTLPHHHIQLVSFHMKGKTLIWFQRLEELG